MVDGELYRYGNMRTGSSSPDSATNVFNKATEGTGLALKDIHFTVGDWLWPSKRSFWK
jgi:hypothetical protein